MVIAPTPKAGSSCYLGKSLANLFTMLSVAHKNCKESQLIPCDLVACTPPGALKPWCCPGAAVSVVVIVKEE